MISLFFKKIKSTKLKMSNVLVIILSLIVAFVAVYKWFEGGTILYYWDTNLPLDIKNSIQDFFFYWHSNVFPGGSGNGWSWLPYSLSVAALLKLFGNLSLTQALLYFSFIFLSIVNFYLLLNYLLITVVGLDIEKNAIFYKIISFLFAIFYALNLYTFYYSYFMFNPQIYIYSLLPLNILALFKLYPLGKKGGLSNTPNKWLFLFLTTLIFMSPGFTTYVFLGQYLLLLFFYLSLYWFVGKYKLLSHKTLQIFLFLVLILLTQWWWFFPSLLGFKELYLSQSALGTSVYFDISSIRSNLLNSVRLFGSPMMNNNPFSWDSFYNSNLLFPFTLFLFPFLIIFTFARIKEIKNKIYLVYFLTIFLFSLFIVKLGNPPFVWLTRFAYDSVPFFGAFRDAWHKAGLFYTFSYFILSSIGFYLVVKVLLEEKRKKLFLGVSFFALIIAGIAVTAPFFLFSYDNIKKIDFLYDGKKYTFSAKTKIPPEYYQLKSVLEKSCNGTSVLVIPKGSMISSAVWGEYGNSYVGQDILNHLIVCNFLNTLLLQNGPDSSNFTPYIMLENGDFAGFKNFLLQNQIGLVLIRKDNVPYYYTNYLNFSRINPSLTARTINKDSDFKEVYENDFFKLYKLNNIEKNYGFALPSTMLFTNQALSSGIDYAVLSKQMGVKKSSVIMNKDNLMKYQSLVNFYVSKANCVGCVKITPSDFLAEVDNSLKGKLKKLLKPLIARFKKAPVLSLDEKISYDIVGANNDFASLMTALKVKDSSNARKYIIDYISSFEKIRNLIRKYNNDFFSKNNKYLEERNFLLAQNNSLSSYLKANINFRDSQIRGQLYFLLSSQNEELGFLNKNIWETDFKNKVYKMRLDIPADGLYSCGVYSTNNGLNIAGISIDNLSQPIKIATFSGIYKFSKGSYPVSLDYSVSQVINIPNIQYKPGGFKEIALGVLRNGTYHIRFEKNSTSKTKVAIVISKGKLKLDVFKNDELLGVPNDRFVFVSTSDDFRDENIFERTFGINAFVDENYYLYFFPLESKFSDNTKIEYKNFSLEYTISNDDIQFSCSLNKSSGTDGFADKIRVEKINPTFYKVRLPQDYKGGFLTFNQTYGADWQAYTQAKGKKHVFDHFSNAYANGWYIDNVENKEIIVEFTRQKLIFKNAIATFFGFIVLIFLYIKIRKKI